MTHWRPLPQVGPDRPPEARSLVGGWCWFDRVAVLERGRRPVTVPAAEVPQEVLHRLTAPRAPIGRLPLDQPRIMAILNATPDSFSDGGLYDMPERALAHARRLVAEGADILDIGGESTRPGAADVGEAEEAARTAPLIARIRAEWDGLVSIDTRKGSVARQAVAAGAGMLNDVSALTFDPAMADVAAEADLPICLMHMLGTPATMQDAPHYDDVLLDVYDTLARRVAAAEAAGIPRAQIVVDPGIGFGKTMEQNLALLQRLSLFHGLGCPILLGVSRKRFIGTLGGASEVRRKTARIVGRGACGGCAGRAHSARSRHGGDAASLPSVACGNRESRGMSRKLFGTDGVRGTANTPPMTAEMAMRLGAAAGRFFRREARGANRVVIGKDTRLSGYMFETALTAGFTSTGMNVLLLGPVPTPAVGMLTPSMRADAGVMISASHNPHEDNGIKFFGPDGFKLSDADEAEIERLLEEGVAPARPANIGRARRIDDGRFRYAERVKSTLPAGQRLDGVRVVVDCANGAAYRTAPEVLWELGAEVIAMGDAPDGTNINLDCGSTKPDAAARLVRERRADLGICLDGDADRVVIIDETGQIADGDQIMALFATNWAQAGRLAQDTLVATVMSNLGLERHLAGRGLKLHRTQVGDRYVVEAMRSQGFNLGGEQSGHIVMTDHTTTGDGLVAGLQFLAAMAASGQPASALTRQFDRVPQRLRNVRYAAGRQPLEDESVLTEIRAAEERLGGVGRLLIRKSGTEPLIRVMAECEDETLLADVVESLADRIARAAA